MMGADKLARWLLPILAVFSPSVGAAAEDEAAPPGFSFTASHRRFLTDVVRRTLDDALSGRRDYTAGYVPAPLRDLKAEAVVRLRHDGFLRAAGAGGPAVVSGAVRDAALAALESLKGNARPDSDLLRRLMIEVEVVGPVAAIPAPPDGSVAQRLDLYVEPGIHGVMLAGPKDARRFCPTEVITSGSLVAEAIASLGRDLGVEYDQVGKLGLFRFRTDHWYEDPRDGRVVPLLRGLTPVSDRAVSPEGLDAAIRSLADYLMYRQLPSGAFTYQYEPALDHYTDDNNLVRQAGTTAALCVYASYARDDRARAAADRALGFFVRGLHTASNGGDGKSDGSAEPAAAAFIATDDGENKLGVTALVALALAEHPDARGRADLRRRLVDGMLTLQRPSGLFITAFPPAISVAAQDYFPGEALLALAADYELSPSSRVDQSFDAAIRFYRDFFRDRRSPAFVPWQTQAFAAMTLATKRQDYAEYVFEMTDWLADRQLGPENCPWPDHWGSIAAYGEGRGGVSTASYLEGFADALRVARRLGDEPRAARYERLAKSAARFVMQLQVRPEEAYFMRSPQDAVGGVRTTLSLNLLRIDHVQHALVALIKTRRVLFGDPETH